MFLLLDIGNTRAKAALFDAGNITELPHLNATIVRELPLTAVYFACVANDATLTTLKDSLLLDYLPWQQVNSKAHAFGVTNCYLVPHLLGADRWLALLGAKLLFGDCAMMIIDAGTALTIDWMDQNGSHQGGWIMPGLRLQQQSVVQQTAKVFNTIDMVAEIVPGNDTNACLQNGCIAAVIGAIQQGWQLKKAERIILTGGDAFYLQKHLAELPLTIVPLLIFHGLAQYIDH
jgi:type III pantothenate kinase